VAKAINQDISGTIVTRARDRTTGQAYELEEPVIGGSGEIKTALGPTYQAYLEARKSLARAFRGRELRDQEAYRDAERRYELCDEAIEKAMGIRENAEQDASNTYREDVDKIVDKASRAYKDRTKQALIECKQRVMDAWRSSADTSTQMTSVCEGVIEKAMKAREKAELNALDAYREDVDKAVDKASQAYKDKMKQALKEYRQRVMDAWRSSMETSAQMTGILEEDGNTRKEEQSPERRSEYQRLQFREMILYLKRGFLSIIQRVVKALELRGST